MSHGYSHGCHCPPCTEKHTIAMRERRARLLERGVARRYVWGHHQSPSGTGWDAYNARHTGPYSTKSPDYAPAPEQIARGRGTARTTTPAEHQKEITMKETEQAYVYELDAGDYLVEMPGPDPLMDPPPAGIDRQAALFDVDAVARQHAAERVTQAYADGQSLDQIAQAQEDLSAWRLNGGGRSPEHGERYAREYDDAVTGYVSELRAEHDRHVAAPAAHTLPQGTPHPDPFLAARGWQADRGTWQRTADRQLEAG